MLLAVSWIAWLLNLAAQLVFLLVLAYAVTTWVLDYYHPVRVWLGRIVEPMLRPIRRVVPLAGNVDLSPLILIILVQLLATVVSKFLLYLVR